MYTHYSLFALIPDRKDNADGTIDFEVDEDCRTSDFEIYEDFWPIPVGGVESVLRRFRDLLVERYGLVDVSTTISVDGEIVMIHNGHRLYLYTPAAILRQTRELAESEDEMEQQAALLALAASQEPIRSCPCCGQPIVADDEE